MTDVIQPSSSFDPGSEERDLATVPGYYVRLGYSHDVYCLTASQNNSKRERGDRVICRSQRGLELGEILAPAQFELGSPKWSGKVVRLANEQDSLLWNQLQRLSRKAGQVCQAFLDKHGLDDVLVDAEPLLDGRTLYFHFLGEPSKELEPYLKELADVYQNEVAQSKFAKLLEKGCGPQCGTKDNSSCGTAGGCAVCSVSGKCAKPLSS